MINFTLTITAAPELLAAMTSFTSAITAARVVAIPEYVSEFTDHKTSREQAAASSDKPAPQMAAYGEQNPSTQQTQAPVQTVPAQVPAVPISVQSYTMEQLAIAATQIIDAGRRTELVNLLNSFGVQAITALPKEKYGAFATQLRQLGAEI